MYYIVIYCLVLYCTVLHGIPCELLEAPEVTSGLATDRDLVGELSSVV